MTEAEIKRARNSIKVACDRAGGITALADLVGVTRQTVHRWRNGETEIKVEHAMALAEAVDMMPADFRPDVWT